MNLKQINNKLIKIQTKITQSITEAEIELTEVIHEIREIAGESSLKLTEDENAVTVVQKRRYTKRRINAGGNNLSKESKIIATKILKDLLSYYGGNIPLLSRMLKTPASTVHSWIKKESMRSIGAKKIQELHDQNIKNIT